MNLITTTDLSLFETTKAERQEFAQSVIKGIKDGISDPHKGVRIQHVV